MKCFDIMINMNQKKQNSISSRIDDLLNQWGVSQKDLCTKINISSAALSSLRKSNGVPAADTAIAISEFFRVDPIWLIKGQLNFSDSYDSRPSEVYDRIQKLLREEQNIEDDYDQFYNVTTISNFHGPLLDYVSVLEIVNWHYNRSFPKVDDLLKIAKHFNKTYNYIAFGYETPEKSSNNDNDVYTVPKTEYEDYCRFKDYKYIMYSYDCLYEPDKKYISTMIQRLFRLRRRIENHDWDFEYNRQHPTEEPRQKDPDISDEEYAEKSKKD